MKNKLRKILAVVLVVVMTVVCVPAMGNESMFGVDASALTGSGSMGGNVKWSYDTSSKTLTISGSGAMSNYTSTPSAFTSYNWKLVCTIINKATKIVVNSGVTSIGNYAFASFTKVTSVSIASSVTSIGSNAFNGCTSLTSVTLNSGLKTIGERAFYGCTSLASVTIPASVTTIGKSAFEGCSALKTVNLSEGLTTIGAYAFKSTKFATVSLPTSVTSIGSGAFASISGLKFTCSYGDAAYQYCRTNTVTYTLRNLVLLVQTEFDTSAKQVKVKLKIISDKRGAAVNAANFELTYNDSVIPVSTDLVDVADAGVYTAIVHSEGKVSVAMMAENADSYTTDGGETVYDIAELMFNVNGQADVAEFELSATALMMNDEVITIQNGTASVNLHVYTTSTVTKTPTCTETGTREFVCDLCGKAVTEDIDIDPENHIGSTEIRNDFSETCGDAGYTGDTCCAGCGTVFSSGSEIAPTGAHSYESGITTAATCHETGVREYDCLVCSSSYSEDVEIDPENHSGETEVRNIVAATCNSNGYSGDTYCLGCDEIIAVGSATDIDFSNHCSETEIRDYVAPTCNADGYTGDTYCLGCGAKLADGTIIVTTGAHHYECEVTLVPTCCSTGENVYTCTGCSISYTEETAIDPNNHCGETEVRDSVVPTCNAVGYTGDTYCVDCGAVAIAGSEIEIDPTNHVGETEVRDAIAPSCTDSGYTGDTYCVGCGELLENGEIVAAYDDHVYVGEVTTAATCCSTGVMTYSCIGCDSAYTDIIALDSTNHTGGTEVKNAVSATCGAAGYAGDTYCKGCNALIEEGSSVSATGAHSYTSRITTASTCCKKGVKTYTCTGCSATYTEQINYDSGNHSGGTEIKNARESSCISRGYSGDTYCKGCGTKLSTGEDLDLIAHLYEPETVEPTCTYGGYTFYTCSGCGLFYRGANIEPVGHDYDEDGYCTRCGVANVTQIVFIENNYFEFSSVTINFTDDSGMTSTETTDSDTNSVVQVIISKTSNMSAADFIALIDGEGWSITDADGNAVEDDSYVSTDCNITHTGGVEYKLVVFGDVNSDGKVNAADARMTLRSSSKLDTFDEIQNLAGDVDTNEKVTASDARSILRVASKLDEF